MSENQSFEDLEVWKRSKALAVEICIVLRECRDYGFARSDNAELPFQFRRISATASGASERSRGIRRQVSRIRSKGSAGELRTQIIICWGIAISDGRSNAKNAERMRRSFKNAVRD